MTGNNPEQVSPTTESPIPQMDRADVASLYFKNNWPIFVKATDNMKRKELIRVIQTLVGWPLEMEKFNFQTEIEKLAFKVGMDLTDAKFIMRMVVEGENLEQKNSSVDNNVEMGDNNKAKPKTRKKKEKVEDGKEEV